MIVCVGGIDSTQKTAVIDWFKQQQFKLIHTPCREPNLLSAMEQLVTWCRTVQYVSCFEPRLVCDYSPMFLQSSCQSLFPLSLTMSRDVPAFHILVHPRSVYDPSIDVYEPSRFWHAVISNVDEIKTKFIQIYSLTPFFS